MKIFTLITLASVAVLILLGMGVQNSAAQTTTTFSPCEVKVNGQKVAAECGLIQVSENRQTAVSPTIEIPVTKIMATTPSGLPIFHLSGGPGSSNMKFQPPANLLATHDVVLVGYRGVDGSVVLDCPEIAQAMKGQGNDLLSKASVTAVGQSASACGARLQGEGIDLDGYNVHEVAQDLETARQALGYDKIHLLSESYGTRVAQVYANLYPAQISRSAMIGVNPPGHFIWEPDVIEEQLADYAALCATNADCAARTDDLAETMRQVNKSMPDRWLFIPIDSGKVKATAFTLLFNRITAVYVFDAYLAAAEGDYSGLALLSFAYDQMLPNMITWGDFFAKGFSADFDLTRNYNDLARPDTVMGSPLAEIIWPIGSSWPMAQLPKSVNAVQPSDVETLLISGNLDFSTPAQAATDELLPALSNGQQIILTDLGHTEDFWKTNPEAATQLLQQFFTDGVVNKTLYTHQPMTFSTGAMHLTTIAKTIMALPLILMAVIILSTGLIMRRRRN